LKKKPYRDTRSVLSFIDGHVAFNVVMGDWPVRVEFAGGFELLCLLRSRTCLWTKIVDNLMVHRVASKCADQHEEMTTAPNIALNSAAAPLLRFTVAAVRTRAVRFTLPAGGGGCT